MDALGPAASLRQHRDRSLRGRAFYESLGSPRMIVAPMVEGSEYCWRELSRQHGADLCYSPMLHARLFAEADAKGRDRFWSSMRTRTEDKLIVQFCANDPDVLLTAARHVAPYCDAVDVNFGCPQGIARKGRYGAFLQEDWDTVGALVSTLARELPIPVTAKIRILDSRERTLAYAKHVLASGATWLAVHCRTREQKGQMTGLGDWSVLRYLRDNLPPETVLLANGNVLYHEDIDACLKATGFDGMLVAEANLHNPAIFTPPPPSLEGIAALDAQYPRQDHMLSRYIDILQDRDDRTSASAVKGHIFKILKPFLARHPDMRSVVGCTSLRPGIGGGMPGLRALEEEVSKRIEAYLKDHPEDTAAAAGASGVGRFERDEKGYRNIPWYRCQPYFRPLPPTTIGGEQIVHVADDTTTAKTTETNTGESGAISNGDAAVQEVQAAERSLKRSIDQVER